MSFIFNSCLLFATISCYLPSEHSLSADSVKTSIRAELQIGEYGDLLKGEKIKKKYIFGNEEDYTVPAKYIKRLYTYKKLSCQEFHNRYYLNNKLWTSLNDAIAADSHKALLQATIVDMVDWLNPTQTHNLKYTFNLGERFFRPTEEEYEVGSAQRTVYGCFVSKNNPSDKTIFCLTITMKVKKNSQK